MGQLKSIVLAALATMALTALAGGPSASATTLAITGVAQTNSIEITTSLQAGGSVLLVTTGGGFANTCTEYHETKHSVSPFTTPGVGVEFTHLVISGCTEGNPTVDSGGTNSITRISGTSNGTVFSNGTKMTLPSPFGSLTCTTSNTDIGTITGVSSGSATMHLSGVINCGIIPSLRVTGTFVITSPHALTVVQ